MDLDRRKLHRDILELYTREHAALGEEGTRAHLERGRELSRRFRLPATLRAGGVLVFPHVGVADCGYQIAACVHACLDACLEGDKKNVLVVSVLHAFTDETEEARRRVAAGGDPSEEASWGVQGPGLPGRQEWRSDHALMSWRHFWEAQVARRGLEGPDVPTVTERYPYLAGGKPGELPGIDEVQALAEDAVVVSTADAFHHGIGYGDAPEDAFYPDEAGLAKAKAVLEEGMALLEAGDYWGYNEHCVRAKSDARDAGQTFRYVRGPLRGRIIDLTYSDASELYKQPEPTWVAAALFDWKPEG